MPPEPSDPAVGDRRTPAHRVLVAAAAVLAVGAAVGLARTTTGPDPAALPAPGTYDLSALPVPGRSATPVEGLRVVVEVVLVSRDDVRLGLSWTNVGDAPTTWGCGGASVPAGRWWATPAEEDGARAWSPQTGALCRTVDDVSVVELAPGAAAADFHRFPRDATWATGHVRVVGRSLDSGVSDPGDPREPDVDLVVDLRGLDPG